MLNFVSAGRVEGGGGVGAEVGAGEGVGAVVTTGAVGAAAWNLTPSPAQPALVNADLSAADTASRCLLPFRYRVTGTVHGNGVAEA